MQLRCNIGNILRVNMGGQWLHIHGARAVAHQRDACVGSEDWPGLSWALGFRVEG